MNKCDTIDHLRIIKVPFFENEYGGFIKAFETELFEENGIRFELTENYVLRLKSGVLKGIHFQYPHSQSRIITPLSGKAAVVAVDLRIGSLRFGEYQFFVSERTNRFAVYVPEGFGTAVLSFEDDTLIEVKASGQYFNEYSNGIRYDDPFLNIDWSQFGINELIISEKDKNLQSLEEYKNRMINQNEK